MPRHQFTESDVEEAALEWLQDIGYAIVGGPGIAAGEASAEGNTLAPELRCGALQAPDAESILRRCS